MPAPAPPSSEPSIPPGRAHSALWIAALVVAVIVVAWDAIKTARHFQHASAGYGVAVQAPRSDPASPTGFSDGRRQVVFPARWVDGQHWIAQTQQMFAQHEARIRKVDHDNAPFGRDVHWASPFRWWLGLCARIDHLLSGRPLAAAVETAAFFANPALLVALLLTLVPWTATRFGAHAAALLALGMAGSAPLRVLFASDNPDHHGAIEICAMLTLFAILAGGSRWIRRDSDNTSPSPRSLPDAPQAQHAFLFSGIAGGIGLWISAVTLIPLLVAIALGALWSAWLGRRSSSPISFEPALWRLWGVAGGLSALIAYLLEYAPGPFSWRLEVNHPLYALAWIGAGELLAQATAWLSPARSTKTFSPLRLSAAVIATLSPLVAFAIGGSKVFVVSDPFLWSFSHDYTPEFRGLLAALQRSGWSGATLAACLPMLLVPFAFVGFLAPAVCDRLRALIALPLAAAALSLAMAFKELRWWTVSYGLLFGLLPFAPLLLARLNLNRARRIGAWCVLWAIFLPGLFFTLRDTLRTDTLTPDDLMSLAERDLAHALRLRIGDAPLVVLSSPATTSRMIYFGSAQGLGTAYWENLDGLKRAAAILAAPTADEAHRLVLAAGVTHLVFLSWDDFVEPYVRLSRGLSPDEPLGAPAFGIDLLRTDSIPPWLQRLPDHLPRIPAFANAGVAIFEVTSRTEPRHVLVRDARFFLYTGQLETARRFIPELARHPDDLAAQVALARVQFAARDQDGLNATLGRMEKLLPQRSTLEPEDRVDLVALLAATGQTAAARSLLAETLRSLDEKSARRLTPGSLSALLGLTRNFGIAWPDSKLQTLALELLPPDGRI